MIHGQWQLIGPETEEELRRQGMPYFDGLIEQWTHMSFYERIARELATKTVRTDDALATAIRRYGHARRISAVALSSTLVAIATLVISHR